MTAKLRREPLAWGMQRWSGLPGTEGTLFWGGPGDGLYFERGGRQIRLLHFTASDTYQTVRQAQRAVDAFVAAYEAGAAKDES